MTALGTSSCRLCLAISYELFTYWCILAYHVFPTRRDWRWPGMGKIAEETTGFKRDGGHCGHQAARGRSGMSG